MTCYRPDDLVWVPVHGDGWALGWIADIEEAKNGRRILVARVCPFSTRIVVVGLYPADYVFPRDPARRGRDRPPSTPPWTSRRCVSCTKRSRRAALTYQLECAACARSRCDAEEK